MELIWKICDVIGCKAGNCRNSGYNSTEVTSEIAFNTELYTSVGGRLRGSLDQGREHLDQTVEIAKTKVLPLLADLKIY